MLQTAVQASGTDEESSVLPFLNHSFEEVTQLMQTYLTLLVSNLEHGVK